MNMTRELPRRLRIDRALDACTLTSTIAAAFPHLPEALVGEPARRGLEAITNRLPAALTRRLYFECRLAEDSRVDLVLCVDRESRTLLMPPRRAWLPRKLQMHPLWTGLAHVCEPWSDPQSPLGSAIYDLWLEFDADASGAERHALVPGVFVGSARSLETPALHALDAGLDALATIVRRPLAAPSIAVARDVVRALPSGANVPYVAVMYSRDTAAIRLCVSPLSGAAALAGYLRTIAWPGDTRELRTILESILDGPGLAASSAVTLLHVDVREGVLPRIGIEIPLPQYPRPIDGSAERTLFRMLCDRGLCATEKWDALRSWPGYSVEQFPHQVWPSVAVRRVSHLKVVYEPGRGLELKTYLSFFHGFLRRPHGHTDQREARTAGSDDGRG